MTFMLKCQTCYFNPRSPHGERRSIVNTLLSYNAISIHAPRTGSDQKRPRVRFSPCQFQSTLPARGATVSPDSEGKLYIFQSTLPARGATSPMRWKPCPRAFQSTLPARGATPAGIPCKQRQRHFNPRSPHGERLDVLAQLLTYQPDFNPRSPHGERRKNQIRMFTCYTISIHAPRTGSDALRAHVRAERKAFQSTLPARGATATRIPVDTHSIEFQSTLPARGATCHF